MRTSIFMTSLCDYGKRYSDTKKCYCIKIWNMKREIQKNLDLFHWTSKMNRTQYLEGNSSNHTDRYLICKIYRKRRINHQKGKFWGNEYHHHLWTESVVSYRLLLRTNRLNSRIQYLEPRNILYELMNLITRTK